jgi:DNA-binding MarR family transcriptional regulator
MDKGSKPVRARKDRIPAEPSRNTAAALGTLKLGRLKNNLGFAVRIAQLSVFQDVNIELGRVGITTAQYSVLCIAAENPGINQATLAEALMAKTPRMVLIIDDLERRGLLTRLPSTVDRRSHAIYLTDLGRKELRRFAQLVDRHERRMLARLRGEDKQLLLRMLRNLADPP